MMTDRWKDAFDSAVGFREIGMYSDAIAILEQLLRDDSLPNNIRAATLGELGGIYLYDLDDFVSSEKLYRKCVAISPRSELASLGLFHSLMGQRLAFEALDEMKRFLSISSSHEYARVLCEIREGAHGVSPSDSMVSDAESERPEEDGGQENGT